MPLLKVCGITDAVFAIAAAERGVAYLGLIFADGSPRRVSLTQAQAIVAAVRTTCPVPPRFVGVFAGQDVDEIVDVAEHAGMDVVRLHGQYGGEAVAVLKARGFEVWRLDCADGAGEDAVLLDGRDGKRTGGTGRLADWTRIATLRCAGRRIVLAGGISAANIAAAVATGADIIDINSSIETAPGVKSLHLLDALISSLLPTTSSDADA